MQFSTLEVAGLRIKAWVVEQLANLAFGSTSAKLRRERDVCYRINNTGNGQQM
jgi:hypothetical protein